MANLLAKQGLINPAQKLVNHVFQSGNVYFYEASKFEEKEQNI